jgi:hypothetical protein
MDCDLFKRGVKFRVKEIAEVLGENPENIISALIDLRSYGSVTFDPNSGRWQRVDRRCPIFDYSLTDPRLKTAMREWVA